MSEQDNTAAVKRAYESFQRGDLEGVLDTLSEDVRWETPLIAGASYGGLRQGKAGAAGFFQGLMEAEEVLAFEPRDFIAQADRVAVLGRYNARIRATGRTVDTPFVHIFTLRNGSITGFFEMYDTAATERAYRQAASA